MPPADTRQCTFWRSSYPSWDWSFLPATWACYSLSGTTCQAGFLAANRHAKQHKHPWNWIHPQHPVLAGTPEIEAFRFCTFCIKDKSTCSWHPRLQRLAVRLMLCLRAVVTPSLPFSAVNFLVKAIEIFAEPNEATGLLRGIILYCSWWSDGIPGETEDSGMSRVDSKEQDKWLSVASSIHAPDTWTNLAWKTQNHYM